MSDTEVKELIRKRSSIKGRLTTFNNYINEFRELEDVSQQKLNEIRGRLSKIELLFNEYDTIQSKIELLQDEVSCESKTEGTSDEPEKSSERDTTENLFYFVISSAQELIGIQESKDTCESVRSHNSRESTHCCGNNFKSVKLPTIKLPIFDGNYNNWLEFHDTFNSLIHNNVGLNEINKFQYLKVSLTGQAGSVIESLEISSNNYAVAWKLICDRYNNKRQLVHNHLKSLFNIPTGKESEKSLRFIIDHISKHLRALNSLKEKTEYWDTLIIFMFSQKLDNITSTKWEEHRNSIVDNPTLVDFFNFLRNRADVLEMVSASVSDTPRRENEKSDKSVDKLHKTFVAAACDSNTIKSKSHVCLICDGDHVIYYCEKFNSMSVEDRNAKVAELRICMNCLRSGHFAHQCKYGPCRFCKRKHNTLLHKSNVSTPITVENNPSASSTCNPIVLSSCIENQVLLSTAIIKLHVNNKCHEIRCLLDCGSQSSFISASLKDKLCINGDTINSISVTGINNMSFSALESCNLTVESCTSSYCKDITFFVIPQITSNIPGSKVNVDTLDIPKNITLADPTFYNPSTVDMLLGADVFWDVICSANQIRLGNNKPVLQNSQFGWLVVGPVMCPINVPNREICCNFSQAIQNQLKQFWELEELPDKPKLTVEEQACQEHFEQHTRRMDDGRFCVTLPLRDNPQLLGNSYPRAKHCLDSLQKRFKRQPDIKDQYVSFINEYADLDHLTIIEKPELVNLLPHHPVIKEQSETTKCRVVFNASSKTDSGVSLNDLLMVGPTVQDDIFSILMRFRQHTYVFTGDIEKMYRQILLEESQRYLQVILWREDEDQPIKYLRLNTVTYGTSSAPFLSTRCLIELSQECEDPDIKEIMSHDFYVDDLISGCNDESMLIKIYQKIVEKLESACLPLRKIKSNSTQFLNSIVTLINCNQDNFKIISSPSHALGIEWNPNTDNILIVSSKLQDCNNGIPFTKRSILSITSSFFDPLGLISCCIITCKMILQNLWSLKLGWDDEIPIDVHNVWKKFIDNVHHLQTIEIPRHACCSNPVRIELHSFSDASKKAYAGCIYLKSTDALGNCTVKLLCARAKVAPLKTTTIPRLELCGALLVARLCNKVAKSLRCEIACKTFWSDSKIVLGWLCTSSLKLETFVAHRVISIQELCNNCRWLYVPTSLNPADLASRGVNPDELQFLSLWWQGPTFIQGGEERWPCQSTQETHTTIPEVLVNTSRVDTSQSNNLVIDITKYSSFSKLRRIISYIFRFYNNAKNVNNQIKGNLSVEELAIAESKLVYLAQQESFPNVETQSKTPPLLSLTPFVDDKGLLRVGGRLENSPFNYEKRHPIIIDSRHHLSRLIFHHFHVKHMHAGPQLLLSLIRESYWPIKGRAIARQTFRNCTICTRMNGVVAKQIMGNLPAGRLTPGFPFEITGTDFAGPFLINDRKGRGSKLIKCYLCIFICFKVKAVHLELVGDLSTEAFILALRRFISRKGKPREIWCDNGSNFVGAYRQLGIFVESSWTSVSEPFAEEGIKFKFSPAYSPNFGGLHEAAVKSAKYHMKRALGSSHLTYEELATLFAQIEAILNSRPLSPLSSNPHDLSPLTPGHFLIGRTMTSLPAPDLKEDNPSRLHRYARLEQARQHFWARWTREYVCELQQRTKWQKRQADIKPGQLVLIKEEMSPPLKWPLGRIEAVYPGSDGACRVADIKTTKGILRRAVNRICPLMEA